MRLRLLLAALLATLAPPVLAQGTDLTTLAERSGFTRTGRYDEVIALCAAFERQYPASVRCFSFGTTPEGRPMQALAVSTRGALTPAAARAAGLPVTLVQAGIHAGEIDGKDAVFWLLRDLLSGRTGKGVLDRQVLLFVPVFNVDGHENFRAWHRPNQRGPEEMGFRVTAQRYNLNRDYVKADTPEMQAMLGLVQDWDPLAEMDLHVTDGAKFRHDISITAQPVNAGDEGLQAVGRQARDGVLAALRKAGHLPVDFYPSFVESDDPSSGFAEGVSTPRFSHGYHYLRNRIGILVETHSWRTYPERVRSTRTSVLGLLEGMARDGLRWRQVADQADARATALAGQPLPLTYAVTDAARTIDFLGYAYTRELSKISGQPMTRYDESRPQVWKVPLRDQVRPELVVTLPKAGYLVPPAWTSKVEPALKVHGIDYGRIDAALPGIAAERFLAQTAKFAPGSVEGHQRVTLAGQWQPARADVPAGALFVPIAQPKARLVANLLEPQAPDAIAAWGGMNNAFEQKEYMEDYVTEEQARLMLARDPALKAQFERRLREDPEFASSPAARLDFFYRRHPAWDADHNAYPVLRLDTPPH